jgi:hypothetical protein
MTTPAQRILAAFADLSADAREVVGESMERQHAPLISSIGSALCYTTPRLAEMVISMALKRVAWDGSTPLADRLSDNEPWRTVKEYLIEALEAAPVAQIRGGVDS